MSRDQLAALASAAATIALGLAPFVALGLVAGLPVAYAAYLVLADISGVGVRVLGVAAVVIRCPKDGGDSPP